MSKTEKKLEGLIFVEGGEFQMGTDDVQTEEDEMYEESSENPSNDEEFERLKEEYYTKLVLSSSGLNEKEIEHIIEKIGIVNEIEFITEFDEDEEFTDDYEEDDELHSYNKNLIENDSTSLYDNNETVSSGELLSYNEDEELFDDGGEDTQPVHTVILDSFYIGKYPVTQKEYEEIMGENPSEVIGLNHPVHDVSWYDAVEYCNKRSKKEGLEPCYAINKKKPDPNNTSEYDDLDWTVKCNFKANGYRLPTEAEWEYAARGGNKSKGYKYSGSDELNEVAWTNKNCRNREVLKKLYSTPQDNRAEIIDLLRKSLELIHEAGQKKPNELGIYDMSGNVDEWCWDWYDYDYYKESPKDNPKGPKKGSTRVARGGSISDTDGYFFRSAYRYDEEPNAYIGFGFRVVRKA